MPTLSDKAKMISRFRKERYLLQLSEDVFRDTVVRPLFLRKGFQDGRDLCGPSECGKDMIFISIDLIGVEDIYAVQTKKGLLNCSKKLTQNVIEAATQMKTSLETSVTLIKNKEKKVPSKSVLCASGKINNTAREYIISQSNRTSLIFMDSDDIIPMIDDIMPEFWFNIDSDSLPYLKALKNKLEDKEQLFTSTELMSSDLVPVASSSEMFVSLQLYRMITKIRKSHGKIEREPSFEQLPITSIITKPHRLVFIRGGAGSGKTTSLLRIIYTIAEKSLNTTEIENLQIPIFLRAKDISENSTLSLIDVAQLKTTELSNIKKTVFTNTDLSAGRVFLMVDALDEVPDKSAQELIIDKIISFNKIYPGCQVIITSREYSILDEIGQLNGFVDYDISPINYRQANSIIKRLQKGKSLPIERSSELLRRLQDVHGMELNPLLVTVFAASTDYSRADIPANITELFKKFTEMMLGRWDSTKGMAQQYQAPLKDFILQKIAFEMHRRRVSKVTIKEFKEIAIRELDLRGYKADESILIEELLFRSSLFRIVDVEVEFRHLMLQEFFAGRGIPTTEVLETLIYDIWWRRAIVFHFGENPEKSDAFNLLVSSIPSKTPPEVFNALITLGLALQACYLLKVDRKLPIFNWLVIKLASIQEVYEKDIVSSSRFPLHAFINYYMWARDSVALSNLRNYLTQIMNSLIDGEAEKAQVDLRTFWLIVGLIEIGEAAKAETLIKKFAPNDKRLFLGIHLGCFLLQHTRVTTRNEKESAARICQYVAKNISDLRSKLFHEFKSELLELRKDAIAAIDK